ncbi:hypothetical protein [Variovorax fucosicus]|uniref:hypothetical protein n=1 Tax=Variovorax fucosicus TaxID=3053517 RepID=UPI002577F39C|nr:hypothetical protein [Variovorax sp. J22G47]MDM0059112.1 hypothetical protein [Variovorax sp. J22G47]
MTSGTSSSVTSEALHHAPSARSSNEAHPPDTMVQPTLWRRLWSHPKMIQYHRLFAVVVLANMAIAWKGATAWGWWGSVETVALGAMAQVMLGNFALAILVRQQYIVNALFWLATRAPTTWPLAIRWQLAKVYHFGGLHSAGSAAGTLWFAVLLASQVWHVHAGGHAASTRTLVLGVLLLPLLAGIVAMALPAYRSKAHNRFELMHRFGGWAALLLFWAHAGSTVADQQPPGDDVWRMFWHQPTAWLLALLTISVAMPWMRLKRVPVHIVKASTHAVVVKYNHADAFPGSSNAVSLRPLLEWHSFANIPAPGEPGFRQIISRAGDWTGALIDKPPSHLWVKGITTAGVANIEVLFKRVVYLATGSGIGPVLPHLLAHQLPMHLVWATRNPRNTYGDAVVDEILRANPDALIWDTDARGKPDLVALALEAVRQTGAEAVICIANQKVTQNVIHQLEQRGIPGYGAIWDS